MSLKYCVHGNLVGEEVSKSGNAYEVRCGNCIAEGINKNGAWRFDKEGNLKFIPTELVSVETKIAGMEHKLSDLESALARLDVFVSLLSETVRRSTY